MIPILSRLSFLLLTVWACAAPEPTDSHSDRQVGGEPIHVVVLHTNDVHGQVLPRKATWLGRDEPPLTGGLARVAAYVNHTREETAAEGAELLVLDAGDWSQGTPEGQIDRGRLFVRALNRIDYDVMCLGNHEFDHGVPALKGLLAEIHPPVVTANLIDTKSGRAVDWVNPYRELNVAGMRVMVVGLLSPETPKITHEDARNQLRFRDPSETLEELRGMTSGIVDWWLPLTHLGHEADQVLAAQPDIPLVVGGHSHRFLREGLRVGDSLVVQAGCKATVVGRVDLWFDRSTHRVLRSEAQLVDLLENPAERHRDLQLEAECEQMVSQSSALMGEVVGELRGDLSRSHDPIQSSPAGNLVAEVTRSAVQAEIGVMNRGGIRTNLTSGPVTRRDLFEICPFDNFVVRLEMTGDELFEFMRRAVEDPEHSGVEVSGATLLVSAPRKLHGLRVGGEPYEPRRRYTVALNSFMASGGDGYLDPEQKSEMSPVEDPRFLRQLLEERFSADGPVEIDTSNHYEITQ